MKLLLSVLIWILSLKGFSQNTREVIVLVDTTYEANGSRIPAPITHPYITKGIKINVIDTPFRVIMLAEKSNNILNGVFMLFYPKTNMPAEKGKYVDGEEDGEWFYWNESGVLIMKRFWKKGKLLKTTKYK